MAARTAHPAWRRAPTCSCRSGDGQGLPEVETLVGRTESRSARDPRRPRRHWTYRAHLRRHPRTRLRGRDQAAVLRFLNRIRHARTRRLGRCPVPQRQWTSTNAPCRGQSSAPAARRDQAAPGLPGRRRPRGHRRRRAGADRGRGDRTAGRRERRGARYRVGAGARAKELWRNNLVSAFGVATVCAVSAVMESLERRYEAIKPHLSERQRRIWLGQRGSGAWVGRGAGGRGRGAGLAGHGAAWTQRARRSAPVAGGPLAGTRRRA